MQINRATAFTPTMAPQSKVTAPKAKLSNESSPRFSGVEPKFPWWFVAAMVVGEVCRKAINVITFGKYGK